jgi:hypothetical protein
MRSKTNKTAAVPSYDCHLVEVRSSPQSGDDFWDHSREVPLTSIGRITPVAHTYQPTNKFCLTPQAPPLP